MSNIPNDLELKIKLIEKASKSLEAYNDLLNTTKAINEQILHVKSEVIKTEDALVKATDLLKSQATATNKLSASGLVDLKKEIAGYKALIVDSKKQLVVGEANLKIRREAIKEVSTLNLRIERTVAVTKKLGKYLYRQSDYFFEQQKSVKQTELSMGILSNQANGFRNNIYKTSISTNQIGIDTKELAKIQGTYSDNIGRGVQLNEEQLTAMASLAKGTMLGAEGAAQFAASMDSFNVSAKGSVEFVDEVVNTANKLGLNSGKVVKNVQKNIKLLNKYNFKNGVKGLGKMAQLATKFKFEMSDIANFAETLMSPEGAVEVASKLQVLGGEWSKLGDPFELMYKSRNDITGLTKDIIAATTATAKFDKKTGVVSIDPMEMQRLREVAKATGLDFDTLANSAREAAKYTKMQSGISNIFNQDDKDFISSMAQFNKDTGEFQVTMQTKDGTVTESLKSLRQITPSLVKSQIAFNQTLKERASQAITFTETVTNIKNMFKTLFFPGLEAFSKALQNGVGDFHKWAKDEGALNKIVAFGKQVGELGAILVNNPIKTGIALLIGKAALWYARGMQLGRGFNSVAGSGSGSGSGSNLFNTKRSGAGMSKMGKMRMNLKGASRSGGAIGGGIIGGAISGYNEWTTNEEAGMEAGENSSRTLMRGGAAGLGGWGGAAAGAAIGSVVPVIGTLIGGIIGGALGAWGGDALGDAAGDAFHGNSNTPNTPNHEYQDFVSRPGENPVSFSSNDTLIGAKKNGPIDKMLDQSIGGSTSGNKVLVEFNKPLRIEGNLKLSSGSNEGEINLNDPILMRDLAKMVQIELAKAIGGGKVSSNPVNMA